MPCLEHPSCRAARVTSHLLPGTQYADLQNIKNTTAILQLYLPFYTTCQALFLYVKQVALPFPTRKGNIQVRSCRYTTSLATQLFQGGCWLSNTPPAGSQSSIALFLQIFLPYFSPSYRLCAAESWQEQGSKIKAAFRVKDLGRLLLLQLFSVQKQKADTQSAFEQRACLALQGFCSCFSTIYQKTKHQLTSDHLLSRCATAFLGQFQQQSRKYQSKHFIVL